MENKTQLEENWTLFSQIKPFLQEAWYKVGFSSPTEIQKQAIPQILDGEDVIAESPTGTGKTIAYLLPMLQKINPENQNIQVLILAPSHELVMQIFGEIQKWTTGSDIRGVALIGGANIKKQVEKLKTHPQIVVGTTGRLLELIKMKKLKMHEVKTIVIDEFDMLIAQEHISNVKDIIKTTLKERQLLFFSATLSKNVEQIANELAMEPKLLRIQKDQSLSANVNHIYFISEQREKIDLLRSLTHSIPMKALAFVQNARKISEVEAKLKYKGIALEVLAGEGDKSERKQSLENFRKGKISLLLATDVAARGLDIDGLSHVIHFDIPHDVKQYIHRSGRTGRMGGTGTVISIITKNEERFIHEYSTELGISFRKKALYKGKVIDVRN